MDILDNNKILLFIIFVIPGFVALKTYQLIFNSTSKDTSSQIIDAVAYSCINYALLLPLLYLSEINNFRINHEILSIIFYIFVLLIAPATWVFFLKYLRTTQLFQRILPHPTQKAWDYVFEQRNPYWIIITLKDGKKIGGRYDSLSFASSSPAIEQIYLEESWVIDDDGFNRAKVNTSGVLVMTSDIMMLEFFNLSYPETGESDV